MRTDKYIVNLRWFFRGLRKLFNYIPTSFLMHESSWQWLRFYPAVTPANYCFNQWNQAIKNKNYRNYQKWIARNSLTTLEDWRLLKAKAYAWQSPPKLSIVTPVHNTQVDVLYECILSVRAQAYPYWQLILVDDGSTNQATRQLLASGVCKDPRIQLCLNAQSQGISHATNTAIAEAQGDYVLFLDHDDRLALDALYLIANEIRLYPDVDIVYSDRDMISPKGKRYMFLFKPDWSPETLLAGNYIFHLMCYRRSFVQQLGGLRAEFDGSQDYDLILRAAETAPQVRHIQKVLYHWRQYQGSVALDSGAKDYAFQAGVKALNAALKRRGIKGVATEISSLWRGNYQLDLACPDLEQVELINISPELPNEKYTQMVSQRIAKSAKPYIAIISEMISPINDKVIEQLAAWLTIDGVALASGSIMTGDKLIDYVGASYQQDGGLLFPYQGLPSSEPGYMAVTQLTRNISAPHPFCVVIRRQVWKELKGFNSDYQGWYSLLDFNLRALAAGWRCVSVPQAQFVALQQGLLAEYPRQDKQLFCKSWQDWLDNGDPYYNVNFVRDSQEKIYHLPG